MADQERLHVLLLQRLLKQRVVVEIGLTNGQIIGRATKHPSCEGGRHRADRLQAWGAAGGDEFCCYRVVVAVIILKAGRGVLLLEKPLGCKEPLTRLGIDCDQAVLHTK